MSKIPLRSELPLGASGDGARVQNSPACRVATFTEGVIDAKD